MIRYVDILHSVTKSLHSNFPDIQILTNSEEVAENECFYVSISPNINKTNNRFMNFRSMSVDIKYFLNEHDSKIKIYEMAEKLDDIFSTFITVPEKQFFEEQKEKTRRINIINNNSKFLKDDISDYLHYSIELEFMDLKNRELERYELMQNIDIT